MSHYHTLLGQIMQIFSRFDFQKAVSETKAEYHARGFSSWNHFTSMLFGQLAGQDSLRGIEAGLATQAHSLYHLGINPIHRSTLAYANEHRPADLFKKVFYQNIKYIQGFLLFLMWLKNIFQWLSTAVSRLDENDLLI